MMHWRKWTAPSLQAAWLNGCSHAEMCWWWGNGWVRSNRTLMVLVHFTGRICPHTPQKTAPEVSCLRLCQSSRLCGTLGFRMTCCWRCGSAVVVAPARSGTWKLVPLLSYQELPSFSTKLSQSERSSPEKVSVSCFTPSRSLQSRGGPVGSDCRKIALWAVASPGHSGELDGDTQAYVPDRALHCVKPSRRKAAGSLATETVYQMRCKPGQQFSTAAYANQGVVVGYDECTAAEKQLTRAASAARGSCTPRCWAAVHPRPAASSHPHSRRRPPRPSAAAAAPGTAP